MLKVFGWAVHLEDCLVVHRLAYVSIFLICDVERGAGALEQCCEGCSPIDNSAVVEETNVIYLKLNCSCACCYLEHLFWFIRVEFLILE